MRKKVDPVNYSNDSHGTGSRCSSQKLQLTQAGLCFVLCALIAILGSLAYFETKQSEINLFRSQFRSVALSISESISGGVARKSIAAGLVSNMYSNGLDKSTSRSFPNFTLPGFEASMSQVFGLSGFKFLAYSPLVTNVTRAGWEEYARKNVALLGGPSSLTESINGSLTVADGISNITATGKEKHSGYISESTHPTWYFPVWQVAPIEQQSHVVMYDPHAFRGSRLTTIDKAIEAREGKFTDTIHLIIDGLKIPATILILPIRSDDERVIGLISGGFTWADILQGIVPHDYQVHCVLSTATSVNTFEVDGPRVRYLGSGDFHDTIFDEYAVAFSPITGSDYTVTIYPTIRLQNEFITNKPTISCVIVVVIIAFTASLVLLYSHLVKNRENILREETARSIAGTSSRDAVLHAKKLYVRYISHEIRTPLNAAHLGLKILENEIRKEKGPHARNRLSTVSDIANACDIAVGILNDLLNYDRLEDGTLIIEPRKILALPFFISTTNLFLLQAEEKGVTFKFDVAEFSHHNDVIMSAGAGAAGPHLRRALSEIQATEHFLGNNDYVNVDEHKMSQVVRNLVSNAIKFTPEGGTVTIRLRKIPPKKHLLEEASIMIDTDAAVTHAHKGRTSSSISAIPSYDSHKEKERDLESGLIHTDSIPVTRTMTENATDLGTLVLEVIDSGVGMAVEDSKRLFKEVIQFNPSELQAGGGSGLGMMITKALADLHGGEVSVASAGKGHGSIFTVTLPLSSPPTLPPSQSQSHSQSQCHGTHQPKDSKQSLGESVRASDRLTALLYHNCSNFNKSPMDNDDHILQELISGPSLNGVDHSQDSIPVTSINGVEHSQGLILIPPDIRTRNTEEHKVELGDPSSTDLYDNQSTTVCHVTESCSVHETSSVLSVCPPKNLRQLNILVVDDSKLNRKMLVKYLKMDDHTVDEAEDGVIAVATVVEKLHQARKRNGRDGSFDSIILPQCVDEKPHEPCEKSKNSSERSGGTEGSTIILPSGQGEFYYDAILMDFMMPNMDGPTATRAIRDLGYTGLIFGVTGNALPSDIEHFLQHGANDVFIKPVNIAALEAALYPILNAS